MFNSCVIVGRAMGKPVILDDGIRKADRKYALMQVECDAAFRTPEGNVKKEIYDVLLWRGISEECMAALTKGMMIAIRGHLTSVEVEQDDKILYLSLIVAEKVTFDHAATHP